MMHSYAHTESAFETVIIAHIAAAVTGQIDLRSQTMPSGLD